MDLFVLLLLLPVGIALLMFSIPNKIVHYLVVTVLAAGVSSIALLFFVQQDFFSLSHVALSGMILNVLDILLLLFFIFQGFLYRDKWVILLAAAQIIVYLYIDLNLEVEAEHLLRADNLSLFMFLVINIVGSLIIWYSVAYMESETMSGLKKRTFTALLTLFLPIMDLIVVADDMLFFFFLFEMTTLASYLLIRFRGGEEAQNNALKALWMNQIGGLAILTAAVAAVYSFETLSFADLMQKEGGYLPALIAFLSMAALVKGASIPFDQWLIGAMVAPTPVSAMLHSATMVKIAPFMILKFSALLAGTLLGGVLMGMASVVFVIASYIALSKTVFKEILGYSTVALLALMMALATLGTKESRELVLVLIAFHALSKALLFLAAGTVEKLYHAKTVDAMVGLMTQAPKTLFLMMLGFVSLTLPPFGLFIGKLLAIEMVVSRLPDHPFEIIVLLSLLVGSALMVMIYFKVASALLTQKSDLAERKKERIDPGFFIPMYLLAFLLFALTAALVWHAGNVPLYLLALPLLIVAALPLFTRYMRRFDRSSPYSCGEVSAFESAVFYLDFGVIQKRILYGACTLLFVAVGVSGVVS